MVVVFGFEAAESAVGKIQFLSLVYWSISGS